MASYLNLPGEASDRASAPHIAAYSIAGDIDVRADISMDDWTPATNERQIISHGYNSWEFRVDATTGYLWMQWKGADGYHDIKSTSAPGFSDGTRHWIRATVDVDDGASDCEVEFFTSSNGTDWSKLGNSVFVGSTQTIQAATAVLGCGQGTIGGTFYNWPGKMYRAVVLSGIGGTAVFDADFEAEAAETASFTEDSSNAATVTMDGNSSIIAQAGTDIAVGNVGNSSIAAVTPATIVVNTALTVGNVGNSSIAGYNPNTVISTGLWEIGAYIYDVIGEIQVNVGNVGDISIRGYTPALSADTTFTVGNVGGVSIAGKNPTVGLPTYINVLNVGAVAIAGFAASVLQAIEFTVSNVGRVVISGLNADVSEALSAAASGITRIAMKMATILRR